MEETRRDKSNATDPYTPACFTLCLGKKKKRAMVKDKTGIKRDTEGKVCEIDGLFPSFDVL